MISGSTQPGKMICTTPRGGARTGALLAPPLKVLSEAGFRTPLDFLNFFKRHLRSSSRSPRPEARRTSGALRKGRNHGYTRLCAPFIIDRAPDIIVIIIIIVKNLPYVYPVRRATCLTRRAHQDINAGFPHWPGGNLFHKSMLLKILPK